MFSRKRLDIMFICKFLFFYVIKYTFDFLIFPFFPKSLFTRVYLW